MRRRSLSFPIILLIRRNRFEDLPSRCSALIDGYVFLSEETPVLLRTASRLRE